MKIWLTVALFIGAILFSLLLGASAATLWSRLNPDHIVVRVIDHQKCSDPEYLIEMDSQTTSVKGSSRPMESQVDAFVYAMPSLDAPKQITYRLRARYSDCAEILSDKRNVERGWILYENIREGAIHHIVRAQ
jgi:hypothetical protein